MKSCYGVFTWILSFLATLFALLAIYEISTRGKVRDAEIKLKVDQFYQCLTEPVNDEGAWYAIVKTEDGEHLGLRFEEQPPEIGVAVKREGKIVLQPVPGGGFF